MRLSNAFFSAQQQDLATNYNVGCPVGEPVGRRRHPQIDFILRAQKWLHDVLNVTVRTSPREGGEDARGYGRRQGRRVAAGRHQDLAAIHGQAC
eukprot:8528610-Pyramimonas_sp.AAC.1